MKLQAEVRTRTVSGRVELVEVAEITMASQLLAFAALTVTRSIIACLKESRIGPMMTMRRVMQLMRDDSVDAIKAMSAPLGSGHRVHSHVDDQLSH